MRFGWKNQSFLECGTYVRGLRAGLTYEDFECGFERSARDYSLGKKGDDRNLLGGLAFAQAFQAIAEAALQWRRRIGIEGYQIPQGLAAVFAEPS
jgi:hypothetical protein